MEWGRKQCLITKLPTCAFDAACRAFALSHNLEKMWPPPMVANPQILRKSWNPIQPQDRPTCDEAALAITDYTEDARLLDGMLGGRFTAFRPDFGQ